MLVLTVKSITGKIIRLPDELWLHIVEGQPEMAGKLNNVLFAIAVPDLVLQGGADELLAAVYEDTTKMLVVVYKENETDGFIITAYFTTKTDKLETESIMAEVIINDIMQALKAVSHSNADNLHIRYDKEADVMYVSFGPPVPADDSELGEDNILYRYRNGEVVGLTVTHFSNR